MSDFMNDFEKACEKAETDRNYERDMENVACWVKGSEIASVTFSQGRFINKILKLAEKHPDEVTIIAKNLNRDGNIGSIVAHIPVSYIKINNPKRELSEEERHNMTKALRDYAKTTVESAKNEVIFDSKGELD